MPVPWVSWDARSALRAFVVAAVAFAIAWLVTAATDEGGVAWGARAGRALPAVPLCAAFGTWSALASRRARSEQLALATLGRSPHSNVLGAALGGTAIAAMASFTLALVPAVDVHGFFPTVPRGDRIVFASGAFIDEARGLRIEADGSYAPVEKRVEGGDVTSGGIPKGGRGAAAAVTFLAAASLSILAACGGGNRRGRWTLVLSLLAGLVPVLVFFHAAAAALHSGRALAGAIVPPCALLAYALTRYRQWRGHE